LSISWHVLNGADTVLPLQYFVLNGPLTDFVRPPVALINDLQERNNLVRVQSTENAWPGCPLWVAKTTHMNRRKKSQPVPWFQVLSRTNSITPHGQYLPVEQFTKGGQSEICK
jgi:hypothetical protein